MAGVLQVAAVAPELRFPEPDDAAIQAREEALNTYRLLLRDMKWRDVPRQPRDINDNTNTPCFQPPADQCVNAHALIQEKDRDPLDVLLRRTRALADDIAPSLKNDAAFAGYLRTLDSLTSAAAGLPPADEDARYQLFGRVMAVRRKIAFANPLLRNIAKLVFVTRETPPPDELNWGTHMCDLFFGFHATLKGSTHGNGIWALEDPFGEKPVLRELVPAYSKIKSADPRWNGQRITPEGGFLSPDVSFDGTEILFSWTPGAHRIREWDENTTFHIMKMKADGSQLEMLTSGGVNDLFPCWLPNGRIMFVSERRGGYGRCHMRPVPNFTLHSMFPDGTDIVCLSPHETNEWEPSVDNNGMVVYTRWDYSDRGFNQAHHAWITYPDGRDPRELNGNTRVNQRLAPHMEQNVRAIPGSRRYVAVAVGHHTSSMGSLVVIDPSVPDDNLMSQVKRLTPEVLLPEAEKMISWPLRPTGCYGTPWPLSEKYYLCVYDGDGNGQYSREIDYQRRKYSITLLDVFGNKVKLFEHPTISCMDPMPLMARVKPPVIPHKTLFGRPCDADGRRPAAIAEAELPKTSAYGLVNVYNSRYPFPEGVKIAALRVWQVLPKLQPYDGHPRLGAIDQMGGRQCLGTVPVEADGSAHFEVPVKTPVYFQALDEEGCAVQTMRTVAYAQAGERLTCNGCHESRHGRAASAPGAAPIAFRRAPSRLKSEPEGSCPYNYPRLVQGVLDAKCVSCHGEKRDPVKMPDLRKGDIYLNPFNFHTSFIDLISRNQVQYYTQFYCGTNWFEQSVQRDRFVQSYSQPGKVGARASRLYQLIKAGHHGVKLTREEMRRLIVFMDSHGAYLAHDREALRQCEGEVVEGIAFPEPRGREGGKTVADAMLLVVGGARMGACVAAGLRQAAGNSGTVAVVCEGRLDDETRHLYAKNGAVAVFENVQLEEVLGGRAGFVSGVSFRSPDGEKCKALAQAVFDATGTGQVALATGAKMVDGHFLAGEGWCYAYRPRGSKNVLVADATAAVPREEVPELMKHENQDRLGRHLGIEIRHLVKAVNAYFAPTGR